MGYIARQLYGMNAEIAHTCGLFCHVGIPVMLQSLKGYGGTLAEALARQDRSFTETENAARQPKPSSALSTASKPTALVPPSTLTSSSTPTTSPGPTSSW